MRDPNLQNSHACNLQQQNGCFESGRMSPFSPVITQAQLTHDQLLVSWATDIPSDLTLTFSNVLAVEMGLTHVESTLAAVVGQQAGGKPIAGVQGCNQLAGAHEG